jgi:hypothetical protein
LSEVSRARLHVIVASVVLAVSLQWIPSGWCKREAQRLWKDDLELQRKMARGVDQWRNGELSRERFMTGSRRFDGEWLFGTYMMAALGYAQSARAHPELLDEHLEAIDDCIDHILEPDVRAFDQAAWKSDPLRDLGSHRDHAAYLGYLNLVLSVRRSLAPDSPHVELSDRISAHLHQALASSRTGLLQTYPGEVYPVDNTAVIASLALHEQSTGTDHSSVLERWDDEFDRWRDPDTGLLVQAVSASDGHVVDGPRGSGTGLAAYFLSFGHPEQSRALYRAAADALRVELFGFGALREYPRGVEGNGDIDSGPLVLGLSISATGFMLAASRSHGDPDTHAQLWATTVLFGAPVDRRDRRHFAFGGPLGDAMMFALLTARPAGEWIAGS